jgi:hypothetical protein
VSMSRCSIASTRARKSSTPAILVSSASPADWQEGRACPMVSPIEPHLEENPSDTRGRSSPAVLNEEQDPLASPLPCFLLLYALLYASFGVTSPFLPTFIETRGISVEQIGLIFGAGTAIRLLSAPLAGSIADRYAIRREVLAVCAIAAAGASFLYLPAPEAQAF